MTADGRTAPRVLVVRRERGDDMARVHELVAAAFAKQPGEPGTAEAGLVEALRVCPDWIPSCRWWPRRTASSRVTCSARAVGSTDGRCCALGPLAVDPAHQRLGVGTALVHAALGAGDALGEPLVALLGHLDYYPRFGFVPGTSLGVLPPVASWADHFQVRTLTAYEPSLRGTFAYAAPFGAL